MTGPLGATPTGDGGWRFVVWAPGVDRVEVELPEPGRSLALERSEAGLHAGVADDLVAATRYWLHLDGGPRRADPASRWQPDGVQGPSALVDPGEFRWTDAAWRGPELDELVIYELHVGTFSTAGTFDGVVDALDRLVDLGITALELMPLSQFPGARNWGYDGVFPFAVQCTYGGPDGLARLVDAAHARGLAVIVDVVYNHFGPEGSVHRDFGPYFTDAYRTPWGDAINVAGRESDGVRRYFLESARWLVRDLHVDGLRVDAIDSIVDPTPTPFVEDLVEVVHTSGRDAGRSVLVIAESAANDPRTVRDPDAGGWGFDAQWNDDFHHALHVALTGERNGYYADYRGVADLAVAFERRFVYEGQRSEYRARKHGRSAIDVPRRRFVVCAQNHDQVGNRRAGDRLAARLPPEALALAMTVVLCSPFTPLLFMGEEYGEPAPFPYFVDHRDAELLDAVRRGRADEFRSFSWEGPVPDPAARATFESARLDPGRAATPPYSRLLALCRSLLRLRREHPALAPGNTVTASAEGDGRLLVVRQSVGDATVTLVANLAPVAQDVPAIPGPSRVVLDTASEPYGDGPGAHAAGGGRPRPAWSALLVEASVD